MNFPCLKNFLLIEVRVNLLQISKFLLSKKFQGHDIYLLKTQNFELKNLFLSFTPLNVGFYFVKYLSFSLLFS